MVGRRESVGRENPCRRHHALLHAADDGILQSRLGRADDRESRDVDDVARFQLEWLVGFDERRARLIAYVDLVTHLSGPRMHRDVFDERRVPDSRARHRPAQPDAAVNLIFRVMGVQAGDRANRKRPRIGRRRVDDGVGGASGEERDPAHLPRLVVKRAGVATESHASVDESGQILARENSQNHARTAPPSTAMSTKSVFPDSDTQARWPTPTTSM